MTAGCQCAELGDARARLCSETGASNAIIVACIGAHHSPQMPLANDNDVVQAFPANGPNQSFSKTVLPRRPRRDRFIPNAHCAEALSHDGTEDVSRSRIRYLGADSQGNASVIWRAIQSAVGLFVTAIGRALDGRAAR